MRLWLLLLVSVMAMPLLAADESAADDSDTEVDPWGSEFEVGGTADGQYLPLALGRDRTGLGLRLRAAFGWDSNVFKEDRGEDSAFLADAAGQFWVGHNFGLFALGARASMAGRLNFGEPDSDMWDLKLGGFFKLPYDGGFGFGISADALYQQLQTYEVLGPIARQDDLRASGAIARAYVGYQVGGFLIFELGFTGQTTDFSEERDVPSLDSWTIGTDFSVYMNFWDTLVLRPYVAFDYEWFRDQLDRNDDGTVLEDEDAVQLLKFTYGVDAKLDFGFIEAEARAYSIRQDDSAAGFERYWQYGVRGAIDLNFEKVLRVTIGLHLWTREYDDRIDVDSLEADETQKTVHERYLQGFVEASWNFWAFFYVGARYKYERRTSDINNFGYADHEITAFIEIGF